MEPLISESNLLGCVWLRFPRKGNVGLDHEQVRSRFESLCGAILNCSREEYRTEPEPFEESCPVRNGDWLLSEVRLEAGSDIERRSGGRKFSGVFNLPKPPEDKISLGRTKPTTIC